MLINWHTLKNLPVYTRSGIRLGKIFDINFTTDDSNVYQYIVRPHFFSGRTFLIKPIQILKISSDSILVDDAIIKEDFIKKESIAAAKIMGGVATTEINK